MTRVSPLSPREAVDLVLMNCQMPVLVAFEAASQLRALPHPQCVVLDVDMPVLSGPEMAEQMLRHDAGEEYIPIVLVSSRENVGELAVRVGTPYFLQKAMPGYAKDLLALVTRALKERRAPGSE